MSRHPYSTGSRKEVTVDIVNLVLEAPLEEFLDVLKGNCHDIACARYAAMENVRDARATMHGGVDVKAASAVSFFRNTSLVSRHIHGCIHLRDKKSTHWHSLVYSYGSSSDMIEPDPGENDFQINCSKISPLLILSRKLW
jgi:hypothetical protein